MEGGLVKVGLRGRSRVIPVLPLDVLPLILSDASEADARRWIGELSEESPEIRGRAASSLRAAALRHEALLRASFAKASDPEAKARLDDLLAGLPEWKLQAKAIEAHPDLLMELRKSLPADWPDLERVRGMIDAVLERLPKK